MYLLGRFYGLDYLWYAFPVSEVVSIIPAIIWLKITLNKIQLKMKMRKESPEYSQNGNQLN